MLTLAKVMRMLIVLGCTTFLAGCDPKVDDSVGLNALTSTMGTLGQEVLRIDDAALTAAYRDHAATWVAATGR